MRIFCLLFTTNPVRIIINFLTKMDNNENNNIEDVENVTENGADNTPTPRMIGMIMEDAFDDLAAIMANFITIDHQMLGIYDNMMNSIFTRLRISPDVLDTPQLDSPLTDLSSTDSSSSSDDEQKQVQEHQEIKEQTESVGKDKDLNLKKN